MRARPPRDYDQARAYLHGFYAGFDRTVARARVSDGFTCGHPLEAVRGYPRIVQVTGTNGKGSTCTFLEALLLAAGKEVVTVTSPHLSSVRERIRVQGEPIRHDPFLSLLAALHPGLEAARGGPLHPSPTQVLFWMALELHRRLGPGCYGVYEVGKGGATDCSNVFASSVVVLTPVSEDHLHEFGGSLASLTEEKLGLCREGGTLVHAPQRPEVRAVIERVARGLGLRTVEAAATGARPPETHGMRGEWQADNFALACAAFREATGEALPALHGPVRMAGRLEARTLGRHTVILDVAHNPESLRLLLAHLARDGGPGQRVAVLGFSDDRPWAEMATMVVQSGLFSSYVATASCRGHPVEPATLAACGAFTGCEVLARPTLKSALGAVLEREPGEIVVFGSCFLCADYDRALHALGMGPYARGLDEIDPPQAWMRALR